MPFVIGETIGPYQLLEQLGQGGMATVYRAYHAALDRSVAIKALHPAFMEDPNFLARFQREARVVARLEHPNIVPIYDFSEHEGRPFLVMKFIEGETLKTVLQKNHPTLAETLPVVEAVGAALAYAHSQGILHRDVKPSNVLVTRAGQIYLADFGLARIAQSGHSTLTSDMMVGTPHYISPEQALARPDIDERSDIYSFGVMIYEMTVGRVPYSADTPFAIVHDHIYSPLPLPRQVNLDLPEAVERFLLKALAKTREDRFPNVAAMVAAYRTALALPGVVTNNPLVPFPGTNAAPTEALPAAALLADSAVPAVDGNGQPAAGRVDGLPKGQPASGVVPAEGRPQSAAPFLPDADLTDSALLTLTARKPAPGETAAPQAGPVVSSISGQSAAHPARQNAAESAAQQGQQAVPPAVRRLSAAAAENSASSSARRPGRQVWQAVLAGALGLVVVGVLIFAVVLVVQNKIAATLVPMEVVTATTSPDAPAQETAAPPPGQGAVPLEQTDAWQTLKRALDSYKKGTRAEALVHLNRAMNQAGDNPDFYLKGGDWMASENAWTLAAVLFANVIRVQIEPLNEAQSQKLRESVYKAARDAQTPAVDKIVRTGTVLEIARARYELYHGDPARAKDMIGALAGKPDQVAQFPEILLLEAEMFWKLKDAGRAKDIIADLQQTPNLPEWIAGEADALLQSPAP